MDHEKYKTFGQVEIERNNVTCWHTTKEHVENIFGAHIVLIKTVVPSATVMRGSITYLRSFGAVALVVRALVIIGQYRKCFIDD